MRKVPKRFDVVAATMAPATLPWAIEVKLIDDCTVEGTRQIHNMPTYRVLGIAQGTRPCIASPTSGNTTKVATRIAPCNFQFLRPSRVSRGSSRAP